MSLANLVNTKEWADPDAYAGGRVTWRAVLRCSLLARVPSPNPEDPGSFAERTIGYVSALTHGIQEPSEWSCLGAVETGDADRFGPLRELPEDTELAPDVELIEDDRRTLVELDGARRARVRCVMVRDDDHLFSLTFGVFEDTRRRRAPARDHGLVLAHGREGRLERAPASLRFRFSVEVPSPAVGPAWDEALQGLDRGFEKVLAVLAQVRGGYNNPLCSPIAKEVYVVTRTVNEHHREEEIRKKQDEFLDAYVEWKTSRRIGDRARMLQLARELSELDPTFSFNTLQ